MEFLRRRVQLRYAMRSAVFKRRVLHIVVPASILDGCTWHAAKPVLEDVTS